MSHGYKLHIDTTDAKAVEKILGKESNYGDDQEWSWGYAAEDEDTPSRCIKEFLDLLEGNYKKLAKIGVERADIAIWLLLFEEFDVVLDPPELKRIADAGISLCVSYLDI